MKRRKEASARMGERDEEERGNFRLCLFTSFYVLFFLSS